MAYFEEECSRCFCAARKSQICMSCEASINELRRMVHGALPIPSGMKHQRHAGQGMKLRFMD